VHLINRQIDNKRRKMNKSAEYFDSSINKSSLANAFTIDKPDFHIKKGD